MLNKVKVARTVNVTNLQKLRKPICASKLKY